MLGGAIGGGMLNPSLTGAAASTAGALGGGMLGANLGRGIDAAINAYQGLSAVDPRTAMGELPDRYKALVSGGGALGGLAGGLGAGYMSR